MLTIMERETQIDLSEKLNSLIESSAQGVQGLEPLIEDTLKQIEEKENLTPENKEEFVAPAEKYDRARHFPKVRHKR